MGAIDGQMGRLHVLPDTKKKLERKQFHFSQTYNKQTVISFKYPVTKLILAKI